MTCRKWQKWPQGKSNFYKYLAKRLDLRIRRLACIIRDIGHSLPMITSGSNGLGLDLNGSDLDIMCIDQNFEAEAKDPFIKTQLIMNTEETQQCFTQLWLLNQYLGTDPNMHGAKKKSWGIICFQVHYINCAI